MPNPFTDRNEFLFVYEARDCNPNGDPLDENRPRIDPETGACTVTDVRIKRTIRDEILSWEPDEKKRLDSGLEILVRDTHMDKGALATGAERANQFSSAAKDKKKPAEMLPIVQDAILSGCIDARLFGSTLPVGKKGDGASLKVTGPVQLSAFNRSLHRVSPRLVQQTAAFAGKSGAGQKSFAERQLLHYALIAAYGVANEVAARTSKATDEDLDLMLKALWQGTNNLATTSKMGHSSLLLLRIEYRNGRLLGQLQQRVRLATKVEDEAIRSSDDFTLDVGPLITGLAAIKDDVKKIEVQQDDRLRTAVDGKEAKFVELLASAGLEVAAR